MARPSFPSPPVVASRCLLTLPFRECRDGFSQPVIGRKHPVVAMPVLPRRRDEIGEPVEELKRREFDDAIGSRPRGLPPTTPPDPVGGLVPREHVADSGCAAVLPADHGEPFKSKGWPSKGSQQVLETPKIARHVAVDDRDPDARVD